jgi:2-haloacid dehalogenase
MNDKAILFDVDGTLLDYNAASKAALKKVFYNHQHILNDNIISMYEAINIRLWNEHEQGKIARETIFNTRFVELFDQLNIQEDGVAFEKEYQNLLGNEPILM